MEASNYPRPGEVFSALGFGSGAWAVSTGSSGDKVPSPCRQTGAGSQAQASLPVHPPPLTAPPPSPWEQPRRPGWRAPLLPPSVSTSLGLHRFRGGWGGLSRGCYSLRHYRRHPGKTRAEQRRSPRRERGRAAAGPRLGPRVRGARCGWGGGNGWGRGSWAENGEQRERGGDQFKPCSSGLWPCAFAPVVRGLGGSE